MSPPTPTSIIAPRPGECWRDEVELLLGKLPATDRVGGA